MSRPVAPCRPVRTGEILIAASRSTRWPPGCWRLGPGDDRGPDRRGAQPGRLAGLALGRLRRKTEELQLACDGWFTAAHGQMCRLHLDACDHLTAKITELDALVAEAAPR